MTSFASNIERILEVVLETQATKILDIGPAFGKYPLMFKEAIASNRSEHGDLSPNLSDIVVDGIEYAEYFKQQAPWLENICNTVYWDDMFNKKDFFFNKYQLITMIDVVEHHDKEKIKRFLKKITVPVLISTPKEVVMYPEKHYGFDQHCSQWNDDDFIGWKNYDTNNSFIRLKLSTTID